MMRSILIVFFVIFLPGQACIGAERFLTGVGVGKSGGDNIAVTAKMWLGQKHAADLTARFDNDTLIFGGILSHKFWPPKTPRIGHWDRHWGAGIFVHRNLRSEKAHNDHGIYVKYGFDYMFEIVPIEVFVDFGPRWGVQEEDFKGIGGIGARVYFGSTQMRP